MIGAPARILLAVVFTQQASAPRTRILVDDAHHNLYASAASGYRSFVALVTENGFAVTPNRSPFSPAALASTDSR
jgi:hypothetical protein